MTRILRLGGVISPSYSPGYIAHYPCFQDSADTVLTDRSGNARHATFGAGLTTGEAWGTANTFSGTDTAAEDYAKLAQGDFTYNYSAGDSLVIAARITMAAPGASRTLFANGWSNSAAQGLRLYIKNTGVLSPLLYHSGGDKFLSDSTFTLADNARHTFMFAWFDHNTVAGTAKYMCWMDGARGYGSETATSALGTVTPAMGLNISGNKTGASSYQGSAAHLDSIHVLRSAASKVWTYAALDEIAMRLHRSPTVPLSPSEFPAA